MFFDSQLDFHDFETSLLPYDIEKILNEFLEDSHIAGHRHILIITGKGKIVRPHVKKLLGNHPLVQEFRTAGYFNGQDGAFEIKLTM